MFFNDIHMDLRGRRMARGDDPEAYRDYMYADDITTVVVAKEIETLQNRANHNSEDVQESMKDRYLCIQSPKTHNILLEPQITPEGVYRRAPPRSYLTTATRLRRQLCREAAIRNPILECSLETDPLLLEGSETIGSVMCRRYDGFPYPLESSIKV